MKMEEVKAMNAKKYCKFGEIILKRLVELGKNRRWLADMIPISSTLISSYVYGKQLPSVSMLYRMAIILNLNCNDLIKAIAEDRGA